MWKYTIDTLALVVSIKGRPHVGLDLYNLLIEGDRAKLYGRAWSRLCLRSAAITFGVLTVPTRARGFLMMTCWHKVKSLSPHHPFVIAWHSPAGIIETGLRVCPSEKKARKLAAELGATLSPGQFESERWAIAAIFRDFRDKAAGFLCNPDCVAERADWR